MFRWLDFLTFGLLAIAMIAAAIVITATQAGASAFGLSWLGAAMAIGGYAWVYLSRRRSNAQDADGSSAASSGVRVRSTRPGHTTSAR